MSPSLANNIAVLIVTATAGFLLGIIFGCARWEWAGIRKWEQAVAFLLPATINFGFARWKNVEIPGTMVTWFQVVAFYLVGVCLALLVVFTLADTCAIFGLQDTPDNPVGRERARIARRISVALYAASVGVVLLT